MPNAWLNLIVEFWLAILSSSIKKPPQERPDNGRSVAFFMATYDGNAISIQCYD